MNLPQIPTRNPNKNDIKSLDIRVKHNYSSIHEDKSSMIDIRNENDFRK